MLYRCRASPRGLGGSAGWPTPNPCASTPLSLSETPCTDVPEVPVAGDFEAESGECLFLEFW